MIGQSTWAKVLVVTTAVMAIVTTSFFADVADASFGLEGPFTFTQAGSSGASDPTLPADPADPFTQAGGHPYEATVAFQLRTQSGSSEPEGDLKDIDIALPAGFYADPRSAARCPLSRLTSDSNPCPVDSQVGIAAPFLKGEVNGGKGPVPIYDLVPEEGRSAEFGFVVGGGAPVVFYTDIGPGPSHVLHLEHRDTPVLGVTGLSATFWGVPSDSTHDSVRAFPRALSSPGACQATPVPCAFGASSSADPTPFLTNSTDCGEDLTASLTVNAYQDPAPLTHTATGLPPEGCDQLDFSPTLDVFPDKTDAGAPAGYTVQLEVPQAEGVGQLGTPPVRDTIITLPAGVNLSPPTASGLTTCSDQQAELSQIEPTRCPLSSQIATMQMSTPLLDAPLSGAVYLGTPNCGPCSAADIASGKMIRLILDAHGAGFDVKFSGAVGVNSENGRLALMLKEGAPLPIESLEVEFKAGPRALFSNPEACGQATTNSDLEPWGAPAVPDAHPVSTFGVEPGPEGSLCGAPTGGPVKPVLSAGTLVPTGGEFSPFTFRVAREDSQQRFSTVNVSLPPGLVTILRGVGTCSDPTLAGLERRGGEEEQSEPQCPFSSQIGTAAIGIGPGSNPLFVSGTVYLSGPYKGAPLSLAIVVPVIAGPFDLGPLVIRSAIDVDSTDAHLQLKTDPLPKAIGGIPLDLRDIRLNIDRPDFVRNPTDCSPLVISADVFGVAGGAAQVSNPFRARACGALPFGPRQWGRLRGRTKRGQDPAFTTSVVEGYVGEAGVKSAVVSLPHSEFTDQDHVRKVCTRVQFAAHSCPPESVYGHAAAFVPALGYAVEGPVYLRSSSHLLPDLVIALRGPESLPVEVDLVGRIDTDKAGGIRTTFDFIPDVEVPWLKLSMQGGKRGLLENSTDLCMHPHRFTVKYTTYSGITTVQRPVLRVACPGKAHKR